MLSCHDDIRALPHQGLQILIRYTACLLTSNISSCVALWSTLSNLNCVQAWVWQLSWHQNQMTGDHEASTKSTTLLPLAPGCPGDNPFPRRACQAWLAASCAAPTWYCCTVGPTDVGRLPPLLGTEITTVCGGGAHVVMQLPAARSTRGTEPRSCRSDRSSSADRTFRALPFCRAGTAARTRTWRRSASFAGPP